MLDWVEELDPRCPVCYKPFDMMDIEPLADHMKLCYTARKLEERMIINKSSTATRFERLIIAERVATDVRNEINKYLTDLLL